ncbi:hypothetical protein ABXN37_11695 [Piscinibacter sakaiensis]|uniref:Uncharacterized protein n=1 Tax=Piscinibacter sakaiensis TaxID=1547922 RepID=A0A0K8NZK8_PISS1|nr:hypothetical protein [Piscinibacter sakaiensis]GAP35813.1 hypothetical protein ISF6_1586 [Piscinibacter sakaiensis]
MTRTKSSAWSARPATATRAPAWVRRSAAWALLAASEALDRLARRVAEVPAAPAERLPAGSEFEFYAQAGAPEGALYVDGQFVGWLPGVTRL